MMTKKSYDRSSILTSAWAAAREAAAAAGEGVRQHIGAAMKAAWSAAKAAAMVPQQAQLQQACAAQEPVWSVREDFHAHSVVSHTVVDGMLILIHHGGHYPTLVSSDGRTTRDAMHVSVWIGGRHSYGSDGCVRVPGSDIPVIVRAHDGMNISRKIFEIVAYEEGEAIAEAMSRIGEATEAAKSLRAFKDAWEAVVRPVHDLPCTLSREEYENFCAQFGVKPMTDGDAKHRQADVHWSSITTEKAIRELLTMRRSRAILKQEEELRQAAEELSERRIAELATRLQACPVTRTETLIVVGSVPSVELKGQELWTVIKWGRDVEIDEDSPSIHGSHLLGCEGHTGREVTFEIRSEK